MFVRVEPDHLVATVVNCLGLGDQRCRVVACTLRLAGAAGSGAHVVLGQPHAHRLHALREVRSSRRSDEQVLVLRGRTHTETDFGAEHERSQVQRAVFPAWHPVAIDGEQRIDRADEELVGEFGHREATGR